MIGRCALFIPAASPAMIKAAMTFEVDALIFDLEDAVAPDEKDAARDLLREALRIFPRKNVFIRINPLGSKYWREDVELLFDPCVKGVILPKAMPQETMEMGKILRSCGPDFMMVPLIEGASAVEEITAITEASSMVKGLLFGAEDYSLSLGVERTAEGDEIAYARARIANIARARGIEALDTPFTDTPNFAGLERDAQKAKAIGYTGKAAINPRHVAVIERVFAVQEDELAKARKIIEAMENAEREGKGAIALDGQMIDAPVVERARKLLERARNRG